MKVVNAEISGLEGEFFLFKVGNVTEDALDQEGSDVVSKYLGGKLVRYNKIKLKPRLMWDQEKVHDLAIWIDRYLKRCVVVSDQFYNSMKELGVCDHDIFGAYESRMKAI